MEMEGLSAICAGLGIVEEDESGNRIGYTKDDSCLENLKDLLRFLRRDDPQSRQVFKQVCKWSIVSKDLIPMMEYCQDDSNLVLNSVKVLVFLTMPIDPSSDDIPQQIEFLWGLKSSIVKSDILAIVVSLLETPLQNLESDTFTEDDWKLVQLLLTLFRNILAIQGITSQQKAVGTACQYLSLRDKCLELFFNENIMDIIMVLMQHVSGPSKLFRHDNLLLLEIIHYIFLGQDPALVARALLKDSKVIEDTKTSIGSLKSIMKEEAEKRKVSRKHMLSRHSQFSPTFTRLTMDGSTAVVKGNPASSHSSLLQPQKAHRGITKRLAWDHGTLPSTNDNILELLHNFVIQFLSGGYNILMKSIREDIEKEHPSIQNNDVSVFFQVVQFVTSFQHQKFSISEPNVNADMYKAFSEDDAETTLFKGRICGPIAASMNESMFQLVFSRWRNAYESLKETNNYKFLSVAGSLMKTMIRILDLVLKLLPEDSKEPQTARILLYKLFYDQTEEGMTQFLLNLIKTFNSFKQPKSDLADLVEMVHVIVRLMESLQVRGTLRVAKKARKVKKKKAVHDKTDNELPDRHGSTQTENDVPNDGQTTEPCITNPDAKDADVPVQVDETEISELHNENPEENIQQGNKKSDHTNVEPQSSTDDSGDEQPATNEVDFKVSSFVSALANSGIIHNLCWLLKFYKNNSAATNHYIICMLQRITDDLELSPMLYQLSLLIIFYDILEEQRTFPRKNYENIVKFLTRLVRKMLKKMKDYPLLFIEVLFWKTRRECHYINAENLLFELGNAKKQTANWGNSSGDGELGMSNGNGYVRRSIADALGDDEADVVINYDLGYQDDGDGRQEGQTSNHNTNKKKKNTNFGGNSVENEGSSKRKRRLVLNDDMVTKIKDLYEKFKDDPNCTRLIVESLEPESEISAAQVQNKLKQLGLQVAHKKRMPRASGASADLEGSSQGKTLRKKARVFTEDQEEMIKSLFEQFKDERRCAHMIANALDPNNTFSAAQISRKLKQLGLVSQKKRSQTKMNLTDEEVNDLSSDERLTSDDELLLSLKNRRKNKDKNQSSDDKLLSKENIYQNLSDDSDDEPLSSIFKSKNKDSSLSPQRNRNHLDDPDVETLGSIFKKTKKPLPKSKETKNEGTKDDENLDTVGVESWDRNDDSRMMDVDLDMNNNSLKDNSEAEITDLTIDNLNESTLVVDDAGLEDSDDDSTHATPVVTNSASRRKLRVVDLEDDD
ncbi:hypothetical protein ACFE04_028787 [Oxalis oulophora]